METASLSIPSDLSALVSTEVARQVRDLKAELERSIAEVRERTPDDRAALVVFSGDLDRVMAGLRHRHRRCGGLDSRPRCSSPSGDSPR